MSKILIIHHNDRDGIVSAAIIAAALHKNMLTSDKIEIEYSVQNYTKPLSVVIDPKDAKQYSSIYLVDYSLSTTNDTCWAQEISKYTCFVWIDHHDSSIVSENICHDLKNIHGIRIDGISAAALCWIYTHNAIIDLEVAKIQHNSHIDKIEALDLLVYMGVPKLIRLVHQYDIWDHSAVNMQPVYFNYGNQYDLDWWIDLLENHPVAYLDSVATDNINIGSQKYAAAVKYNEQYCRDYGFETTLRVDENNYSVFAVNKPSGNSLLFGDIINNYDIVSVFNYVGPDACYRYSIYSREDGVDVGKIARSFGGGGHVHAAGFKTKKLIYLAP